MNIMCANALQGGPKKGSLFQGGRSKVGPVYFWMQGGGTGKLMEPMIGLLIESVWILIPSLLLSCMSILFVPWKLNVVTQLHTKMSYSLNRNFIRDRVL